MNPLLRKYISRNVRINNGDTLGHVELIVWLEQCNQGDQRHIFGMRDQDFKNLANLGCFRHFVCVFVFFIFYVHDLKCSFVSLYISEFIANTYLPRSFALPAFSRTEYEN